MLLSCVILGMMYILAALIDWDRDSLDRLISMNISFLLKANSNYATTLFISDVYHWLPFLYSCVSFLGVLMLLLCTPLGFARLFTIVGDLVIKPNWSRNLDEEFYSAKFEEDNLAKKVQFCKSETNHM